MSSLANTYKINADISVAYVNLLKGKNEKWFNEKGQRYLYPESLQKKGYPKLLDPHVPNISKEEREEILSYNENLYDKMGKENLRESELEEKFLSENYNNKKVKDYEDVDMEISDIENEILAYDLKQENIEYSFYQDSRNIVNGITLKNVPYEMQPFLYEYLRMTSKEKGLCTISNKGVSLKITMEIDGDYLPPECVDIDGKKCVAFTVIAPESRKEKKMRFIDFEILKEDFSDDFSEITLDWIEQRKKK